MIPCIGSSGVCMGPTGSLVGPTARRVRSNDGRVRGSNRVWGPKAGRVPASGRRRGRNRGVRRAERDPLGPTAPAGALDRLPEPNRALIPRFRVQPVVVFFRAEGPGSLSPGHRPGFASDIVVPRGLKGRAIVRSGRPVIAALQAATEHVGYPCEPRAMPWAEGARTFGPENAATLVAALKCRFT